VDFKHSIEKYFFLAMVGIAISMMVLGMSASGSKSLSSSFNVGKVCDVRKIAGREVTTETGKDNNSLYLPEHEFVIDLEREMAKWKFLYLDLSFAEKQLDCSMNFYNRHDELKYNQRVELVSGMNKVVLQGEKFSLIRVRIVAPEKCSVLVKSIQVREKEKLHFHKKDFGIAFVSFIVFFIIYFIISRFIQRINFYKIIIVLQDIYIVLGNALLWIPQKFSEEKRQFFRRFLIAFWMTYMMLMANLGKYNSVYYKYHAAVCSAIIFLISILLLEKPLKHVMWKNTVTYYWLALSVIMCVSEYFVSKKYLLTGCFNVFLFGFLYFIWNNRKERNCFIKDIMQALKWVFFPALVFSIIFRGRVEGAGYAGPTWNPNVFAMFLVPVVLLFLTEIIEFVAQRQKGKKLLGKILAVDIGIVFTFLADSRIGNLMLYVVLIFFIFYLMRNVLSSRNRKKAVYVILMAVLFIVPVYIVSDWAVDNIPHKVGKSLEFPADDFKVEQVENGIISKAAEKNHLTDMIIYAPKMTQILSGRNMYWMGYVRNLNFLGHKSQPKLWNKERTAHNGMLAIAYQYGILALVPYAFMFVCTICVSFCRLFDNKNQYSFFVFGTFVISLGFMLVENFERPFLATEWILFYLLLGGLFYEDEKTNSSK
jgi:hypothetical protein